jgi:hypothetical protein
MKSGEAQNIKWLHFFSITASPQLLKNVEKPVGLIERFTPTHSYSICTLIKMRLTPFNYLIGIHGRFRA